MGIKKWYLKSLPVTKNTETAFELLMAVGKYRPFEKTDLWVVSCDLVAIFIIFNFEKLYFKWMFHL